MKQILLALCFGVILGLTQVNAQTTIADARAQGVGSTVTVTGTVINGDELGLIRYIQDSTGGLAIYSNQLSSNDRGDNVTVTGTLKDYNQLMEMDPVTSATTNSSGNTVTSKTITISEIGEANEGMLVTIQNVIFADAGGTFSGSSNYSASVGGLSFEIRIHNNCDLVGELIPTGSVNITGIISQYSYSSPTEGYQILVRDANDIESSATIWFTSTLSTDNISQTGFDVHWSTNINGSTEAYYGNTPNLELGAINANSNTTNHTLNISGATASEVFYIQPFSVNGNDTAFGPTKTFITQSNSTGKIRVCFNQSVDNSVATYQNAVTTDHIDDTVLYFINNAQSTIDVMIYNINILNIVTALNDAHNRGVDVRVISCGSTLNSSLSSLDAGINQLERPDLDDGIMHNKIVITDVDSENSAWVVTGSTNFTTTNLFDDANNMIMIQDKSLAIAYTLEFNEMWGSDTLIPNAGNAKFGANKTDNTPHEFIINGSRVELYFSPSDQTSAAIYKALETIDNQLDFAVMSFTRNDLGDIIEDAFYNSIPVKGIIENIGDMGTEYTDFVDAGMDVVSAQDFPNIMHHKYCIIDVNNPASDPILITGSHNWSNSAEDRNGENTLIIHNDTIANIYYQEFIKRYTELATQSPLTSYDDAATTTKNTPITINVLSNDINLDQVPLTVSILENPTNGNATVNTPDYTITYTPNNNYHGTDVFKYKVAQTANQSIADTSTVTVTIEDDIAVLDIQNAESIKLYPNPATDYLNIDINTNENIELSIINEIGKTIEKKTLNNSAQIDISNLADGIYYVQIKTNTQVYYYKVFVK